MNSFDHADWGTMADQLEPTIEVDYSDLRGEPAARVTAADYVRFARGGPSRPLDAPPAGQHRESGSMETPPR
jgi:hypothetical protein